jgi:hypothetical protein
MSELAEFAARLIELEGGAVETVATGLSALLPPALSTSWHAPEELTLSEAPDAVQRLAYGTELLDRMIETATSSVSIAGARLDVPTLRGGQIRSAAEHFGLRNGVVEINETRIGPQTRLVLSALATMQGDEKRELVVSVVLSPWSGTEVVGFAEAAFGLMPDRPPELLGVPESVLAAGLKACARRAESMAQGFRDGMTRRFERDHGRIEAYFDDLLRELEKRASRGKLDPSTVEAKRSALRADRGAKHEALSARFVLRITVMPIALRIVAVEGGFATLMLRRRKASRTLELEYDAATRRIVPPRCDGCGAGAPKPAACDDALHLLCEACAPRAEGRVACPACRPALRASRTAASDAAFPPQPRAATP